MKPVFQFTLIAFVVAALFLPTCMFAQTTEGDVIIGKTFRLQSKVLGEERQFMISLPNGYDQTSARYPVLYLLDGRTHFLHATSTVQYLARNGRMPQMIVVAIVNVNRTRDFTPTTMENRPASGGAENFIKFMKSELFPYVEENYRTEPYRLLEGHSLGGMFSIQVLFDDPEMFQVHFAMSPYIMWDNNFTLNQAIEKMKEPRDYKNFLYITLGDEPNYVEPLGKLTNLLETKKPAGLEWHYTVMENDNHGTVPLKSLYFGLETLYKDWILKAAVADRGLAAIQDHYKKLSLKLGYNIDIPENVLNATGYRMMGEGKLDLAIKLFLHNVKINPQSANVYDSLGEGYEAAGELKLAQKNYEMAVKKGTESDDNNLAIYKEHLANVTRKLSKSGS